MHASHRQGARWWRIPGLSARSSGAGQRSTERRRTDESSDQGVAAALGLDDVHGEGLLAYITPARTFLDLLASGFSLQTLCDAYRDAVDRGLVRRSALRSTRSVDRQASKCTTGG